MNQESASTSSSQLIDWTALSKRFGNRQDFIDKLLRMSHASHIEMLEKLQSAIRTRDLEAIAFIAHGLRGTAGNLEAQGMRDLASETEASVRAGRADPMALAEELARLLERLLAELARHLESSSDNKRSENLL